MKNSLLVISVVSLFLSFTALRAYLRDRKRSFVSVTGTVVEHERKEEHDHIYFTPIYEYHYAGQTRRGRHRISSGRLSSNMSVVAATQYPVGTEVPLLVDEHAPDYSLVDDRTRNMNPLSAALFLGIGLFCGYCALRLL